MKLLLITLAVCSLAMAHENGAEVRKDLPQVPEAPARETDKVYRFCGRTLARAVTLLCNGSPELDAIGKEMKDNLVQSSNRVKSEGRGQSVIKDCCYSVCTLQDLMEYCN